MSLGQRIRKTRQILNITQQGLAKALGTTPQYISYIEQEKGTPSLPLVPRLAEELGVTTDYLLTGKENIITGTIPAIKGDKSLTLKAKKALIAMVEELRGSTVREAAVSPDPPREELSAQADPYLNHSPPRKNA